MKRNDTDNIIIILRSAQTAMEGEAVAMMDSGDEKIELHGHELAGVSDLIDSWIAGIEVIGSQLAAK